MSDLQPSMPSSNPVPMSLDAAPVDDDFGFALGCECADPALQIERWMQEARAGADPS
jgi:hypothetical protein